ncbi:MAG: hypothetical protein KGL39_55870 [Patescibacteria group bacterium]|nr:hypothetical protein [Patescibacteria group bacterium]
MVNNIAECVGRTSATASDTLHAVTHALGALNGSTPRTAQRACEMLELDDGSNTFEVYYRVEGDYYPESETSPAEFPVGDIDRVCIGGRALRLEDFSDAFQRKCQQAVDEEVRS